YRTTDGGATWAATSLPDPPGLTDGELSLRAGRVHAFGSTLLVEVGGSSADARGGRWVYRSLDGGVSWSPVAAVPDDAPVPVTFVTATRWILLLPGRSLETTDAGAAWHAFQSDYSQAAPVGPVTVFADPEVGYATVRGVLNRTVDGGAHWEILDTPGTR
ncbi:MAG: WD40/YVTN/BNR-like repeat-containing protein, partial [Solirubrobacteraceae bacterium]